MLDNSNAKGEAAISWWHRLWRALGVPSDGANRWVSLTLPEWTEQAPTKGMRVWLDIDGDVLSLAETMSPPSATDEVKLRQWCRGIAESRGAGLIEARALNLEIGPCVSLIYKRLQMPAYIYSGMLITPARQVWLAWTMVAGERGTTGVREAVVTATLMSEGRLTIEEYESSWGQDPYEANYRGVDRRVLRFMSDDEIYDEQFPQHPLSKVRRLLATLPYNVHFNS